MRVSAALLLLLSLLGGLLTVPALADEEPAVTTKVEGRLVLLLDSSGSMKEPAAGGGTKIDAAKQALTDVVGKLPDDAEVGMRVFGATVFDRDDKGACTDTQNVVPVGPLDREALAAEIEKYKPYGETPIGNALKGAAQDVGGEGKRTIVLLSDGEPTCAPDPCKVARDLRKNGVDLTVNVVGLDVSGAARKALQCVARAGGGTYYDVNDPDELAGSMVSVSVRALREFALTGEPVEGGETASEALPLEPGQYTDRLAAGQTARYYELAKEPGAGLRVSATARPESSGSSLEGFDLTLSTPEGASCAEASVSRTNVLGEREIVSAGLAYLPGVTPYADETCEKADRLLLEVAYDNTEVDKAYELLVAEQPAVRRPASLPGAVEDAEPFTKPARVAGDPEPVLGGADFNSAPELAPGVYSDTIRPGEQLAYKVPVAWGQAARVTVTAEPDALAAEELDSNGNTVGLSGYNPVRQKLNLLADAALGVEQGGFYNGEEPHRMTMALAPVGLRNVESGSIFVRDQNLAGDYFFTVEMARFDEGTKFAAPLRIEVELEGDVSGVPEFDEPEASASPEPQPESGDDEAAAEDDGSDFLLPALGLLVVLAGVVGLGWWAMRRRTPRG